MAKPNLPVNIDSTYADDVASPDVKAHQQHHDLIHPIVNLFDPAGTPAAGWGWVWNVATGAYTQQPLPTGGSSSSVYTNVHSYGANNSGAFGAFDSTAAIQQALAVPGAHVFFPGHPTGYYTISSTITIAPGVTVVCGPGVRIKLANMARCVGFTTNGAINNGDVSWYGGDYDGNDPNQGDEAADGNNFGIARGFNFVNGNRLTLEGLTVRSTRGHAINHWNWKYLVGRKLHFEQDKNSISPSGGRRRDGITGSSLNIDLGGISGYTNDDLIGIVAGATWGGPNTVQQQINTVRLHNLRPEVCKQDSSIFAYRAASLYLMNGYQITDVDIDGISGTTALAHVKMCSYKDAGDPESTRTGTFMNVNIRGLSGFSKSFADGESFITMSYATFHKVNISDVARRMPLNLSGIAAEIPAYPTLVISESTVKSLSASNWNVVAESTLVGRDIDLISIRGGATVDRMTLASTMTLVQPSATTPGALTLVRKDVTNTTPTALFGVRRSDTVAVGTSVLAVGTTLGNGADADTLTDEGIYYTVVAAANWPFPAATAPGLIMTVVRSATGFVTQIVTHSSRSDGSKVMTRYYSPDTGIWSAWLGTNALTGTKWREGIDSTPSLVSPSLMSGAVNQGGTTASRPTGTVAPLYMKYWDTTISKLITLTAKAPDVWRDSDGVAV